MSQGNDLLIVGALGAMGKWFTNFFEQRGWQVDVNDKTASDSENVPLADADQYDVVMIAVPIDKAADIARDVGSKLTDGLLMDVTGVKAEPVKAMRESVNKDVEVLGSHPMYGPSVESMNGQTVIMVKERSGEWTERVEDVFREAGANIKITSAEKHDEMMSIVQGLTHFTYISVGSTLESLEFDVSESREFISPVYSIMLDFVGRIVAADPHLYADMQRNQPVGDKHKLFIESAERLKELIKSEDHSGIVEEMRSAAQHYDDRQGARSRTDKLIQAHVREYQNLLSQVGEKTALVNVGSPKQEKPIHYGTVENIDGQQLYIKEGPEIVKLHIGNVMFLSDYLADNPDLEWNTVAEWKAERLGVQTRSISVCMKDTSSPEVIKRIISEVHEDVLSVEFIESWDGDQIPNGDISYTYEITIIRDGQGESVFEAMLDQLRGIGGTIR